MTLSNTLLTTITNRLNINLLNEEQLSIKNLRHQTKLLREAKESSIKYLSPNKLIEDGDNRQDLTVMYVINLSFLRANTTVHVSDVKGNVKLFYSAGSVDLTGKQKRKRRVAVSKLISLILKKSSFLATKPIALHLNNVSYYKGFIVDRLKNVLYIRIIKSFNQTPYNGCRKRKLRRKKYTKKFK